MSSLLASGVKPPELLTACTTVAEAPHDWLFPKMAAVVHHGGAGTTAAGLRAGKPALIVPFIADQPFWGKRVHELAVGPAPISQRKLNGERLAAALTTMVSDPGMRLRAEALGAGLRPTKFCRCTARAVAEGAVMISWSRTSGL